VLRKPPHLPQIRDPSELPKEIPSMSVPPVSPLQSLESALGSPDQESVFTATLGNSSSLGSLLNSRAADFTIAQAHAAVKAILDKWQRLTAFLADPAHTRHLVDALSQSLEIVLPAGQKTTQIDLKKPSLTLDKYWRNPTPGSQQGIPFASFTEHPQIAAAVTSLTCDPRSLATVCWWFRDWLHLPVSGARAATTTIISPSDWFRLEIDLEAKLGPSPGVIVPDFPAFGLTSIRHSDPNEDLVDSMERAWAVSGLSRSWQARWRIVSLPAAVANGKAQHFKEFSGRSAEAAALCTMLAASGDPFGDRAPVPGEKTDIDPAIVLTARLDLDAAASSLSSNTDPRAIPLGVVPGEFDKLQQCHEHEIAWLLFGPQSEWDRTADHAVKVAVQDYIYRRDTARKNNQPYTGVEVAHVNTVGEALEWMLLTGRLLREYQERVRTGWLGRWHGDSGKSVRDLRPWPVSGPDSGSPTATPDGAAK